MKFSSLDRAHPEGAARTFQILFPDVELRARALHIVADSIEAAHAIDPNGWGVTLGPRFLRLNVGRGAALSLAKNQLCVIVDARAMDSQSRRILEEEAHFEASSRLKTAPHAASVTLEGEQIERFWPLVAQAHLQFVSDAARGFDSKAPQSTSWRDAHSPGVLQWLHLELERNVPSPAYAVPLGQQETTPEEAFDARKVLEAGVKARGLSFPSGHLAAFFTALSSKGFVILSGPSGVGKTSLATAFASLLPQPGQGSAHRVRLEPSRLENGQVALPTAALRYLPLPRPGEVRSATALCDGAAYPARLVGEVGGAHLQLRGAARKWLGQNAAATLDIETEWGDEGMRPTFRLLKQPQVATTSASNHLFLPVRSDWRDEKPLLGYFNPLANRYEWTAFLHFLMRASASFRAGDGAAYFVIFDEMNLARVEWYFADLLSLLEAGRGPDGTTREPLSFDFDSRATGELPPRQLHLPPNLYIVGTINADESTQNLSPKVLDRAWVLEAPSVDFANYPPRQGEFSIPDTHQRELLSLFTREGKFAVPDKALIAAQLELVPTRRDDLSELNHALESYGAGFGFRVFDEILTFCAVGRESGFYPEESAAFDAAIAFKIAPRLRGGRGQAEPALKALLQWSESRGLEGTVRATRRLLAALERDGFLP